MVYLYQYRFQSFEISARRSDLRSPDGIHLVRPALVILGEEVLAKNCAQLEPQDWLKSFFLNSHIDILLIYIYICIYIIGT